ncbi:minor capsid protein [Melghirimyces algeriensis]|uniref:Minor capsid protein n=1 Tax=Melghirimyces algeriensis TaxID=910412 RepID=A0A521F9Y0_9BACL|nr:minor capsid protein [Melghirimyces algeriensis]SMO93022.1 hypothetical protein SAMN06264849_11520 [Melghirimyces algeriensis]
MRILDLINWIKGRVPYDFYPNEFQRDSPDASAYIRIYPGEGVDSDTGKRIPHFQVLVRGDVEAYPETEEKSNEIFNAITNQRDIWIGNEYVVQIKAQGSAPFYIGLDENRRPVYSMNFRAIIKPNLKGEK